MYYVCCELGSIQESRPTRGSFCGSFAEVSASFADVSVITINNIKYIVILITSNIS